MSGRHTGTSDIPLTAFGERQVSSTGRMLVGPGKFLDPKQVRKVWVSPRQRATRTFRLLFSDVEKHSDARERSEQSSTVAGIHEGILAQGNGSIEISEDIREWDYDEYEGMKASEVIDLRKKRCLEQDGLRWSVWRDGCEGGESKAEVEKRLDRLVKEVQDLQRPYFDRLDRLVKEVQDLQRP